MGGIQYNCSTKKEKKKKLDVNYCKHNIVYHFILPLKRDVNVFCVQTETALSGRHCILKQGQDVFITLSRSIRFDPSRSEYMRFAVNYRDRQKGTSPSLFQQ